MSSPLQILCTGDLHLGRYPSRVPTRHRELSIEQVWEDVVTYAIQQTVDVVALTGDVVDNENATYESFGPLQRGLEQLDDAEIATVAVAGNHDYDALPRIDNMVKASRFSLLGRGGQWEETLVETEGTTPVQFVGWSFRDAHDPNSPIDGFRNDLVDNEVPTVGLLHAEIGSEDSVYAPVSTQELRRQPVAAWLLGHIHQPQRWEETAPPILYPGSPQPLDPSDTGARGPRLVEVNADGKVTTTALSRATVRYESVEVDVGGEDDIESVEEAVTDALRDCLREALESQPELLHMVCRLRLTGRTSAHRQVGDLASRLTDRFELPVGEASASVDKTEVFTRPDLNLERIAEGSDPPAVLATLLRAVEEGEETDLVKEAWDAIEEALKPVLRSPAYRQLRELEDDPVGQKEMKEVIREQGLLLLDELLDQTEPTD